MSDRYRSFKKKYIEARDDAMFLQADQTSRRVLYACNIVEELKQIVLKEPAKIKSFLEVRVSDLFLTNAVNLLIFFSTDTINMLLKILETTTYSDGVHASCLRMFRDHASYPKYRRDIGFHTKTSLRNNMETCGVEKRLAALHLKNGSNVIKIKQILDNLNQGLIERV